MFQVTAGVIVTNEKLDLFGKAGAVVQAVSDYDTKAKVHVRMDVDGEVYEFEQSDVRGL